MQRAIHEPQWITSNQMQEPQDAMRISKVIVVVALQFAFKPLNTVIQPSPIVCTYVCYCCLLRKQRLWL